MREFRSIKLCFCISLFLVCLIKNTGLQAVLPEPDIQDLLKIGSAKTQPIDIQIGILRNVFETYKLDPNLRTDRLQDAFMGLFQDIYNRASQLKDYDLIGFYDSFKALITEVKSGKNLFKQDYVNLFSQQPDRFPIEVFENTIRTYKSVPWQQKLKMSTKALADRKALVGSLKEIDVKNVKKIIKNAGKLLAILKKYEKKANNFKRQYNGNLFTSKEQNLFATAVDTIAKVPFRNNNARSAIIKLLKNVKKEKNPLMTQEQKDYVTKKLIPYVKNKK